MSVEPLTRAELDQMTCAKPGCDHRAHQGEGLVMNGACHPRRAKIFRYWADGIAEVRCKLCNRFIMSVRVDVDAATRLTPMVLHSCGDPDCKEPESNHKIVIKPPCHREAGLEITYATPQLIVQCFKCKEVIETIGVASPQVPS